MRYAINLDIHRLKSSSVRRAIPADAGAILDLESNFPDADRISPRSLRRMLKSASADCLVVDQDGVIGASVLLYRKGLTLARLYSISVAPEAKGRGLGKALLTASEAAATARGCDRLRLEVRRSNLGAISLYERAGFCVIGEKPSYYDDGEAALIMQLTLPSGDPFTS